MRFRLTFLALLSWVCMLSLPLRAQMQPLKVRVSEKISQGMIVHKVQPKYPKEARKKHIEGPVVLQATISRAGDVIGLNVVKGDPLLVPSALVAVKRWKYKPYVLNGEPVQVETQITVNYTLSR